MIAPQDQPRAHAQHRRLQEQAQRLGQAREHPGPVRGRDGPFQRLVTRRKPAVEDVLPHAQAMDQLGLGADGVGEAVGLQHGLVRLVHHLACHPLVQQGQHDQQRAPGHRQPAQPRMEQEDRDQEHRGPGQVEQGDEGGRGQKPLHGFEVAQPGVGAKPPGCAPGQGQHRREHPPVQPVLEPGAGAGHDPAAGVFQHAHDEIQEGRQQGQRQQRLARLTAQHAVIDLQHVDRPRQHQQVDEHAEHKGRDEQPAPGLQRAAQLTPSGGGITLHAQASYTFQQWR